MSIYDGEDDKNRLFETHEKVERSWSDYFKLILIVAVCVSVVGAIVIYFNLEGVGDEVKAPEGLELQVKNHFLDVQKRPSLFEKYYYCGPFYWARVTVEARPDVPNKPHNMVTTYRAKAVPAGEAKWTVTASPILPNEPDTPCSWPL